MNPTKTGIGPDLPKACRFSTAAPAEGQRIQLVDNYGRRLGNGVYQRHDPDLGGHIIATRGAMKIVARPNERWQPNPQSESK